MDYDTLRPQSGDDAARPVREQQAATNSNTTPSDKYRHGAGLPSGHRHASVDFRGELAPEQLKRFKKPSLAVNIGLTLLIWGVLLSVAGLETLLYQGSWELAAALYPLAGFVIARQQRCLELQVHDASHRTWYPHHPVLNDAIANVLAAWPVLSDVQSYWAFHRVHHASYGGDDDPCRRRFLVMRKAFEPGALLPSMLRYVWNWYQETGRNAGAIIRGACWHLAVMLSPALIFGWRAAAIAWLAFWLLPQFVFLPWLRFVAELEEHDYDSLRSEAESTYSNVGWLHRWVIHPMNDGYHLCHHAYPAVSQWRHAELHRLLLQQSARYRDALARTRPLGARGSLKDVG